MTTPRQAPPAPPPCPGCGGSGQTSYFGGASRFMLTWEDCPDCCGTGIVIEEPTANETLPAEEQP